MMKPSLEVHQMSRKERGDAQVYLTHADLVPLEEVATRLAAKYPADAYERFWKGTHRRWSVAAIAVCLLMWGVGAPWWGVPIPWLLYTGVTCWLPRLLWQRLEHAPRWAHPAARLDDADVVLVSQFVLTLKPVQRAQLEALLPVKTGDEFYTVLEAARRFRAGYSS